MNPFKNLFQTVHYLRMKFLLNKKMDQSRRYFALLLSLQGDKKRVQNAVVISDQTLLETVKNLRRQRRSIDLGTRIEKISSLNH